MTTSSTRGGGQRERPAPDRRGYGPQPRAPAAGVTLGGMDVHAVDPRDQSWEVDAPHYRVHFLDASGASEEHEVSRADVVEVLAWAEAGRGIRTYVLYACVSRDGLGLVRLAGVDPNNRQP